MRGDYDCYQLTLKGVVMLALKDCCGNIQEILELASKLCAMRIAFMGIDY